MDIETKIDEWLVKCGVTQLDPNTDLVKKIEILDGIIDEYAEHIRTARTLIFIGFLKGKTSYEGEWKK